MKLFEKNSSPHRQAKLILEDGSEFTGWSFGKARSQAGEMVFTTAMAGIQLSLSDPGFKGQILVAAYPLATDSGIAYNNKTGEVYTDTQGIPLELESTAVHAAGFVVSELCTEPKKTEAPAINDSRITRRSTLSEWLEKSNVPGIYGIDTRALVKRLREYGNMRGKILVEGTRDVTFDSGIYANPAEEISAMQNKNYLPQIHNADRKTAAAVTAQNRQYKIALIDCGTKANVIRCLLARNAEVLVLPWNHDLKNIEYDGLMLSGGPGDPKNCGKTIATVRRAFDLKKPVFGTGLGCNIMALAAGGDSYKLPYGHRGTNQPCIETGTSRCYVTSQNHGYAIRSESLPKGWDCWFVNGNDNSVEGIKSKNHPFFAVQFAPEGCPGPRDTEFLFDRFLTEVSRFAAEKENKK